MALQLGALRDALVEAGASESNARAAAEEVASYEMRLAGIDGRLGRIEGRLDGIDGRLTMMTWAIGLNVAMTAGVLWRLLTH